MRAQTHDRIKHLLGADDVTSATRLVLVNAIYLKANWAREFDQDQTANRAFTNANGHTAKVPTMRLQGGQDVALAQGDGWKATELRYAGAMGRRRSR